MDNIQAERQKATEDEAQLTGWMSLLDTRQRNEVEFAQLYVNDFNHGTAGHNRLVLIDKLVDLLNAMRVPLERSTLPIPYHSQHEDDAQQFRKDCGPACVEMIGKYYHPNVTTTTDEIMHYLAGSDRSIYISELQLASLHFFNIELDRFNEASWEQLRGWVLEEQKPVLVLGHYGSLLTRMDRGWTGGHFSVVAGFDYIDYQGTTVERVLMHDPNFYRGIHAQGAFIPLVRSHFMAYWNDAVKDRGNPQRMALVPKG